MIFKVSISKYNVINSDGIKKCIDANDICNVKRSETLRKYAPE